MGQRVAAANAAGAEARLHHVGLAALINKTEKGLGMSIRAHERNMAGEGVGFTCSICEALVPVS